MRTDGNERDHTRGKQGIADQIDADLPLSALFFLRKTGDLQRIPLLYTILSDL